jgi:hypothetical protein
MINCKRLDTSVVGADFSGKVHPDGFFTIGVVPPKKVSHKEREYDRLNESQYIQVDKFVRDFRGARIEEQTYFIGDDTNEWEYNYSKSVASLSSSIDINFTAKKSKNCTGSGEPTKRNGLKGITLLGRRRVIDGCTILEQTYGIKRLGFGTLTIPNLSVGGLAVVNKNWGRLIDRFHKALRRVYTKLGMNTYIVGVTEVQTKRLANRNEFALHYHFVYPSCSKPGQWYFTANYIRSTWERLVMSVLIEYGCNEEVKFSASINLQPVKKSAKNYLSKYVSKGKQDCENFIDSGHTDELPRQWWSCTKALRDRIKSAIIPLSSDICYFLLSNRALLLKGGELKKISPSATYKMGDTDIICGYWGIMGDSGLAMLPCRI